MDKVTKGLADHSIMGSLATSLTSSTSVNVTSVNMIDRVRGRLEPSRNGLCLTQHPLCLSSGCADERVPAPTDRSAGGMRLYNLTSRNA
jgi:hypothetical protein